MKTFKDLYFEARVNGTQATLNFDNGYGVSVITGPFAYCDKGTYELAALKGDALYYSELTNDDVLGYLSPDEITEIMVKLQELPKYDSI